MKPGFGMTDPQTIHYGLWDGSSTILCAFILVVLLIYHKRKSLPPAVFAIAPVFSILILILYLPHMSTFLARIMPGTQNEKFQVLRRFRWIILPLPALAFGLTHVTSGFSRIQRILVSIIAGLFLFTSIYGTDWSASGLKTGFWDRTDTMNRLYKISNISIAMGDTIMENSAEYLAADKHNYVKILAGRDGSGGIHADNRDALYYAICAREYISPVQYLEIDMTEPEYQKNITGYEEYVLIPDQTEAKELFCTSGYSVAWCMDGYCFLINNKIL